MHDKTIRRRRAVLALLVVISLALLTDYFGGSSSGPLHSVQQGISTVLSPLQSGASTVLSPFRDAANYVGSTFKAQSELQTARDKYNALVKQYAKIAYEGEQYRKIAATVGLDNKYGIGNYDPLYATLIGADPVLWYDTITLDKGSDSGVRQYDPVVAGAGLIGDVTRVTHTTSVVSLITSPNFAIGASIENQSGAAGLIQPQVGDLGVLELINLPPDSNVSDGQLVVTNDLRDAKNPTVQSYAPAGIPIGTVSSTNPQSSLLENRSERVTPLADLQHLSVVQILRRRNN
ncbi:MAG TPA: rod shape-determining protein MreC [Solirubrobacteraceae bacterium]|nr:rod shape-determining protein MreC [Solirubrobacteraceae bacterium]